MKRERTRWWLFVGEALVLLVLLAVAAEGQVAASAGDEEPVRIASASPTPAPEATATASPEPSLSAAEAAARAAGAAAGASAGFVDIAADAGADFTHRRAELDPKLAHIMTWMTSINAGVAAADYDGDGDVDFYALTGAPGQLNGLLRNDGPGADGQVRFVNVAAESGAGDLNEHGSASMDAIFADFDNDGDQDLFVAQYGRNRLLFNEGGHFKEVTEGSGLDEIANSAGVVALDYDGDGLLDLMVGNYFAPVDLWNIPGPKILQTNFQTARNGGANHLYRNLGDGRFQEEAEEQGLDDEGWGLALGAGDLDNDGDQDLYLANDFGYDRVYRNDGGRFTDISEEAIGGDDTDAGMNVDIGDFDNDGNLDVYVANITNKMMPQGNMLWQNLGDMVFTNMARFTNSADGGWGWGAKFLDFDHDGDQDIFTVNGYVSDGEVDLFKGAGQLNKGDVSDIRGWPDMRGLSLSGYEASRLFVNNSGDFEESAESAGVADVTDGRGIALGDIDLDGDLDMYVSNVNQPAHLYRNDAGSPRSWIQVELRGRYGNRDAIGTRLTVEAGGLVQIREVDGGNGFSGQSSRVLHVGLGGAETVESLTLRWPNGTEQRIENLPAFTHWVFEEPAPALSPEAK
ncbi:MAG: CRTAC1 family protein [Acidobacteriota bacterium]